jgi:hypothetical protein
MPSELFALDASYFVGPWAGPVPIATLWVAEGEVRTSVFCLSGEVVAVEGDVAVVRVAVRRVLPSAKRSTGSPGGHEHSPAAAAVAADARADRRRVARAGTPSPDAGVSGPGGDAAALGASAGRCLARQRGDVDAKAFDVVDTGNNCLAAGGWAGDVEAKAFEVIDTTGNNCLGARRGWAGDVEATTFGEVIDTTGNNCLAARGGGDGERGDGHRGGSRA